MRGLADNVMATTHRLSWRENVDVSGGVQLSVLTLWGLFVVVGHLISEYRRLPWMVIRVQPAIVSAALGGIVFLAMLVALRLDAAPGARSGSVVRVQRVPILLLLSAVATAFITRSIIECLLFAWVLVVAWAAGRTASKRIHVASEDATPSECITSVGIGLSLLILITTALGFAGWLYRGVLYSLLSGITLLLLRPILTIIGELRGACLGPAHSTNPEPDGFRAVGISLLGALIAMSSVSALTPEVRFDALTYHLAAAKVFAERHRIVEIPEMIGSYYPGSGIVLYAVAQVLSGPKLAKLFNFGFGLLTLAVTYVIGTRYFCREVGTRAALIFFSLPLVFWASGTAYNDLSMSFFCLLGILLFLNGAQGFRSGNLYYAMSLSGLAFGTALGIKPTPLVIMALLGIALLLCVRRHDTVRPGWGLIALLVLFSTSILFSFHWYLRSYLYTGNPIFPWLNSLFRSPYWTRPDMSLNLSYYGMGSKPLDLILLPWNMTFHPERFVEAGSLGVVFLAFLPLLPHARNPGGAGPWLFLICGGFLIFWIATGQNARYLLPVLPLLAILYSAALVRFCKERLRSQRLPRRIVHAVFVIALIEQAALWFPLDDTRFPYTVALGKESDADYLARVHPVSKVWAYANEHLGPETKMLSVVNEFTFFSNHRPIAYSYFSAVLAARRPECFPDFVAADSTYQNLIRCGYTHLLVDRSSPYFTSGQFDHTVLTKDSFYETYLEKEYTFGDVSLYKVRKL